VRQKLGLPSPFDLRLGDPPALSATEARQIVRAAGIVFWPTWVASTPWTTLDDYLDVLARSGSLNSHARFGTDSSTTRAEINIRASPRIRRLTGNDSSNSHRPDVEARRLMKGWSVFGNDARLWAQDAEKTA
jgi:hypothetical protein